MHALPASGPGIVRGELRRDLIVRLAKERIITLVDRSAQPSALDAWPPYRDEMVCIPNSQTAIVIQAVEEEKKRLLLEQKKQADERRKAEEEAELKHNQWLTSLPRYTRN